MSDNNWRARQQAGWKQLDDDQRKLVKHMLYSDQSGTCFATAGAGKTRALITGVAKGLADGVIKPEDLVIQTFTKAGSAEMLERLSRVVSPKNMNLLLASGRIGTIHGVCGRSVKNTDIDWRDGRAKHPDAPPHKWAPSRNLSIFGGREAHAKQIGRERRLNLKPLPGGLSRLIGSPANMLREFIESDYVRKEWGFKSVRISGETYHFPLSKHYDLDDWPKPKDYLLQIGILEAYGHRQGDPDTPERLALLKALSRKTPYLEVVWSLYARIKYTLVAWDFNDILHAFTLRGELRADLAVFDEYQDNNYVQNVIRDRIVGDDGRYMAVGDTRQSIFAFRGANPGLMRADPSTRIFMRNNYRSGERIINLGSRMTRVESPEGMVPAEWSIGGDAICARRVDPNGIQKLKMADGDVVYYVPSDYEHKERVAKMPGKIRIAEYANSEEESVAIAHDMLTLKGQGVRLGDMACIGRTNAMLAELEIALIQAAVPCYRRGSRKGFFQSAISKDFIAWLRIATQDDVEAFERVYSRPRRPNLAFAMTKRAIQDGMKRGITAVDVVQGLISACPKGAVEWQWRKSVPAFKDLLADMRRLQKLEWHDLVQAVVELFWVEEESDVDASEASPNEKLCVLQGVCDRYENLADFLVFQAEVEFGAPGFSAADLADAAKPIPDNAKPAQRARLVDLKRRLEESRRNQVALVTCHGSKGLEWPMVWTSMSTGMFPSYRSMGDPEAEAGEQRLAFVTITRAIDLLTVTSHSETVSRKPAGPSTYVTDYIEPYIESEEYQSFRSPVIPWKRSPDAWRKALKPARRDGWTTPYIDDEGDEPTILSWAGPDDAKITLEGNVVTSPGYGRQEAATFEDAIDLVVACFEPSRKVLTAEEGVQRLLDYIGSWEGKSASGRSWPRVAKELAHRKTDAARILAEIKAADDVLPPRVASRVKVWVDVPRAASAHVIVAAPRRYADGENVNTIHNRQWKWVETGSDLSTKQNELELLLTGSSVVISGREGKATRYTVLSVRAPEKAGGLGQLVPVFEVDWTATGTFDEGAYPALKEAIEANWSALPPAGRVLMESSAGQPFKVGKTGMMEVSSCRVSAEGVTSSRVFRPKVSKSDLTALVSQDILKVSAKGVYTWSGVYGR